MDWANHSLPVTNSWPPVWIDTNHLIQLGCSCVFIICLRLGSRCFPGWWLQLLRDSSSRITRKTLVQSTKRAISVLLLRSGNLERAADPAPTAAPHQQAPRHHLAGVAPGVARLILGGDCYTLETLEVVQWKSIIDGFQAGFSIKYGGFPASYVSLQEGNWCFIGDRFEWFRYV